MTRQREFGFERLIVWQRAREALLVVEELCVRYRRRRWALCRQLSRSALSVVLNIAEGAAQFSPQAKRRYYEIALASASETCTNVVLLADLEPLARPLVERALDLYDEVIAMLTALYRK
jgi:four helix bundle protein